MCFVLVSCFERFFLLITYLLCFLSFLCHFLHRCSLSLPLLFFLFPWLSAWPRCPTSSTAKATPSCQAEKGVCSHESQDHALTSPPFLFRHHCAHCCRSLLYPYWLNEDFCRFSIVSWLHWSNGIKFSSVIIPVVKHSLFIFPRSSKPNPLS